ncbi:hypothetical protein DFH11DRAFT_223762 [Phellopilus nigrolimitatus]|nr:hypothetical protein DFH11DRAFT_223762 [Phellopilus nigrolimitatus]
MAPRITIHTPANGKSWHGAQSVPKGKERLDSPPIVSLQTEADYESDGTDELDAFSRTNGALPQGPDAATSLQPQWETISTTTTSASAKSAVKKPRQKPPTTRTPGQSLIPMSRVESIIQVDPENGFPSKEATFIISLATEEFIHRLTQAANTRSKLDNRGLTSYTDVADTAHYFEEFNFLKDLIPRTLSPKAALAERARILERRDALLSGLEVEGEQNNTVPAKIHAPVATLSAFAPKGQSRTRSSAANGKAAAKSKAVVPSATAPTIRSERQRNKKARLSYNNETTPGGESVSAGPPVASGSGELGMSANADFSSSTGAGNGSGVKIKIRPRMMAIDRQAPSQVLPLGPPAEMHTPHTNGVHKEEAATNGALDHLNLTNDHDYILGHGSGKGQSLNSEEKGSNVLFAPVGVNVADPPLWTRVPLPPPPSPKAQRSHENRGALERVLNPSPTHQATDHPSRPGGEQAVKPRRRPAPSRAHQMPPPAQQGDAWARRFPRRTFSECAESRADNLLAAVKWRAPLKMRASNPAALCTLEVQAHLVF